MVRLSKAFSVPNVAIFLSVYCIVYLQQYSINELVMGYDIKLLLYSVSLPSCTACTCMCTCLCYVQCVGTLYLVDSFH